MEDLIETPLLVGGDRHASQQHVGSLCGLLRFLGQLLNLVEETLEVRVFLAEPVHGSEPPVLPLGTPAVGGEALEPLPLGEV